MPFQTFLGEGFPTKIDYSQKGAFILTSLLEDLVMHIPANPASRRFTARSPASFFSKGRSLHARKLHSSARDTFPGHSSVRDSALATRSHQTFTKFRYADSEEDKESSMKGFFVHVHDGLVRYLVANAMIPSWWFGAQTILPIS